MNCFKSFPSIKSLLISLFLVVVTASNLSAQDYIARIKNTNEWSKSDLGPLQFTMVKFDYGRDKSNSVIVIAVDGGRFEFETTPVYNYISGNGGRKTSEKTLPHFMVGNKVYSNVNNINYSVNLSGKPGEVKVYQIIDNGVEYSIIALFPIATKKVVDNFIMNNLELMPLKKADEPEFIKSVETMDNLLRTSGGAKMSDDILMVSAYTNNKNFVRDYRFLSHVSKEDIEYFTSKETTKNMVDYEVENTPLVKTAVELGYAIVVNWYDKSGKLISTHTIKY